MNISVLSKRLALIGLLITTPTYGDGFKYNNDHALWDQAPLLLCQGTTNYRCTGKNCTERKSKALWAIDFTKNTVDYKGIDYSEKVQSKAFNYFSFGSTNSIFLSSGRAMDFLISESKLYPGKDIIFAALFDATGTPESISTEVGHFECYKD